LLAGIALLATVVAVALWAGLLLMLTTILHPVYLGQDASGFAEGMSRFLPIARRSPTNDALIAGIVLGPVVALVGLAPGPVGAPLVLTAVGLALVVAGPLLTSRLGAEPDDDVVLAWDPAAPPPDWLTARARWVHLNRLRATATRIALVLFVLATWLYLVP
jgi:hypothetical protein